MEKKKNEGIKNILSNIIGQVNSEEGKAALNFSSIAAGDFFKNDFFRRQAKLLILIVIMTIIYIDNRYTSQRELIEIDRLKKELVEAKYYSLAISSELTERSRQSKIEEYISGNENTISLETASAPPFLIKE